MVLGKESVPAEALKLAAQEKARAQQAGRQQGGYRAPGHITGRSEVQSDAADEFNVVERTGTLRQDGPKVGPNSPCTCGSGKKFKKCCGRLQ